MKVKEPSLTETEIKKDYILIGASRLGDVILGYLPIKDTLVIDFDPNIIESLGKRKISAILGDISDYDILEKIGSLNSKLVISTSPDLQDTLALINYLKDFSNKPHLIVRAENSLDAEILYKNGADYVIVPTLTSGHYIGEILKKDLKRID